MKFAKATKFHRKSGKGLGEGSPRLWSAGGAAQPTFRVPRLRRSDDVAESMPQPFRAGLKFGYRPYGPRSDSRSIFEFSHTLFSPGENGPELSNQPLRLFLATAIMLCIRARPLVGP
jgi:hypothetical protein